MSDTDAYDRWLEGHKERIYDTLFETELGSLNLKRAVIVPGDTSIRKAVAQMNAAKVGAVLIGRAGAIEGIFTERDLLRKVVEAGVDVDATPVSRHMTRNPECLHRTDSVAQALNLMVVGGYRNVPVVDDRGAPIGVFSMRAWVAFCVELFPQEILNAHPPQPYSLTPEGA